MFSTCWTKNKITNLFIFVSSICFLSQSPQTNFRS